MRIPTRNFSTGCGCSAADHGRPDRSALLRRDAGPARTFRAAFGDAVGCEFLRGISRPAAAVRPQIMDGLIDPRFCGAMPDRRELSARLSATLSDANSYEEFLDRLRLFGRRSWTA